MKQLLSALAISLALANGAEAGSEDANGNLVTIRTAAGPITVSPGMAGRMQGFIADLAERGYKPKRVKCYSLSKTHVPKSLHKTGEACDFDQRGWNKTAH